MNQPNEHVRSGIQAYNQAHGFEPMVEGHYVKVDADRARRIAAEFDKLPKWSNTVETYQAYAALAREIDQQWAFATEVLGIDFEPWQAEGQPYANSEEMCADVRDHKHLWFFQGGEPHPYLGTPFYKPNLSQNDRFRAVHDLFGHAAEGYQFGPRGEENAWLHHSQMFSALAQKALTTETRGQNSWVNFGPFADLPVTERPFADQKAALLPDWCCDWRSVLQ
jgi:hypothetical protein